MTNKDKNWYIPWIGVVVSALILSAVGRFITLKTSGEIGTANLVFIILLAGVILLYLLFQVLVEPLFSSLFKRIKIRQKPAVRLPEAKPEQEQTLTPIKELPTLTPIEEIKRTAEERQAERTAGQIRIFHEYTHYAVGPYVASKSLSRLCDYIELYVHGEELPKDITPIRTNKLSNYDLFHFGWNMAEYFNIGKKYEVVPWLQFVFANLRDLEPSYIKGKLSTPRRKHDLIPITDNIPEELARLKG